jgi:hypothetical protein
LCFEGLGLGFRESCCLSYLALVLVCVLPHAHSLLHSLLHTFPLCHDFLLLCIPRMIQGATCSLAYLLQLLRDGEVGGRGEGGGRGRQKEVAGEAKGGAALLVAAALCQRGGERRREEAWCCVLLII